jgi:hypothetical protein
MVGRIFVTMRRCARLFGQYGSRPRVHHETNTVVAIRRLTNAWRIAASNGFHQVVFRHGIKRPHTESAFVNSNCGDSHVG